MGAQRGRRKSERGGARRRGQPREGRGEASGTPPEPGSRALGSRAQGRSAEPAGPGCLTPHGPASAPAESPPLPVCLHPRPGTASPSTAAEYPWAPLNTPRYRCIPTLFFFTFFAWNSSLPQVTALLCKSWCQSQGAGTKPCPKARAGQDCLAQPRCGLRLAKPVVERHGQ